ncbi:DoxX family protein [Maribacter halichondriae]|uniref:DoxX family protein n=1 Tax=Maribacter halichondriae TaxID=2980554 RepID=UPI002358642F|nr:DoxX family protein [Maribacter sp. Hal144]
MIKIPKLNLVWIIRYWLGIMLMYHSYWFFFETNGSQDFTAYLENNHFPLPNILGFIAKSVEFFGGLLLVLGLWTRLVSILIVSVLGVAVFYMHKGLFWSEGELAFCYLLMAIILFFNPEIPFKIFNRKNNKNNDEV